LKKALVFTIAAVIGLGLAASAQMSGTWDVEISIDPGATIAGDLFVDLTTSLDLDYTIGDWVFGATAGFDRLGWSSMKFDAAGVLGAFSFTGVMNFLPRTIVSAVCDYSDVLPVDGMQFMWDSCWYGDEDYITYTYGAAFDDLTFTASVSIAGVTFEGLFFLNSYTGDASCDPLAFYYDGSTLVQTAGDTTHYLGAGATDAGTGSGFRFKLSGTAGSLEIESLTYFSLTEPWAKVTCGYSLDKKGSGFKVSSCDIGFTEQYFHIDGFTFGCATFEVGLDILCSGFNWVAFGAHDIDLGVWGLMGDFYVKFGTLQKSVDFCLDFDLDVVCFDIGVTLDYEDYFVGGFSIDSIVLETALNGVDFTSTTYFDGCISTVYDEANQLTFLKPYTGITAGASSTTLVQAIGTDWIGYWTPECVKTEYWCVWETFELEVDGDSCCGGAFDFAIETGFGTKKELDAYAWNYQFDNDAGNPTFWAEFLYEDLETGDTDYDIGFLGPILDSDADGDDVVDIIDYTDVVGATAKEQLLTGTVYDDATSDSLFSWVYTNVELSIGLGSAWSLTFGAEIDIYGWNGLSFGFEFEF
jgi:hypothetical protein